MNYSHTIRGVMIAGAILFTFRWEMSAGGQGVYRLDRLFVDADFNRFKCTASHS